MRATLLVLLLLAACAEGPSVEPAALNGGYRYSAATTGGEPLLTGRLALAFPDDSTLSGTWVIQWAPGADTTLEVGPQVGSGDLVGTRRGDTLLIQLNPTNADDNVTLRAAPGPGGYHGEWQWITITGPRTGGSFAAVLDD